MIFKDLLDILTEGKLEIYLYTSYRGDVEKSSDGKIKSHFELDMLDDFLFLEVKNIRLTRYFDKNSYDEKTAKPLLEVTLIE